MGWSLTQNSKFIMYCVFLIHNTHGLPPQTVTQKSVCSSYKEYMICVSTKLTNTLQNVTFIKYGKMEYTALVRIHFISNTFSLLIKHLNNLIVSSDWSLGLCYWGLK